MTRAERINSILEVAGCGKQRHDLIIYEVRNGIKSVVRKTPIDGDNDVEIVKTYCGKLQ